MSTTAVEIRPVSDAAELARCIDLTARWLAGANYERVTATLRAAYESCPVTPPELWYVVVQGREVIGSTQILDLRMQIGGVTVSVAGMQGSALAPEHRGRDLFRQLYEVMSTDQRSRFDIAIGFAVPRLYRRVGAVPVVADTVMKIEARTVPVRAGSRPFRDMRADDEPFLVETYHTTNAGRSGIIHRPAGLWPWLIRRPEVMRIRADGYFGYTLMDDGLHLTEVGGSEPGFYPDVLAEAAATALAARLPKILASVPPDHPLVDAAAEYGARVCSQYHRDAWCCGRVVAPASFLEAIRPELEKRLQRAGHAAVRLHGSVSGEAVDVTYSGAGTGVVALPLEVTNGELLQMAMGYRAGRAILERPGTDRAALLAADCLFPRGNPFIWKADRF